MRAGSTENRSFCHPSQKPIEVMAWCIPSACQSVFDPYMGSGTTGVACARLGKSFIGVEIEPEYFDVACERIQRAYDQADLFSEVRKCN